MRRTPLKIQRTVLVFRSDDLANESVCVCHPTTLTPNERVLKIENPTNSFLTYNRCATTLSPPSYLLLWLSISCTVFGLVLLRLFSASRLYVAIPSSQKRMRKVLSREALLLFATDWQVFRSGFNGVEAHTYQTCSTLDISVSVRRRLLLYMSKSRFLYFCPSFTSQLHH